MAKMKWAVIGIILMSLIAVVTCVAGPAEDIKHKGSPMPPPANNITVRSGSSVAFPFTTTQLPQWIYKVTGPNGAGNVEVANLNDTVYFELDTTEPNYVWGNVLALYDKTKLEAISIEEDPNNWYGFWTWWTSATSHASYGGGGSLYYYEKPNGSDWADDWVDNYSGGGPVGSIDADYGANVTDKLGLANRLGFTATDAEKTAQVSNLGAIRIYTSTYAGYRSPEGPFVTSPLRIGYKVLGTSPTGFHILADGPDSPVGYNWNWEDLALHSSSTVWLTTTFTIDLAISQIADLLVAGIITDGMSVSFLAKLNASLASYNNNDLNTTLNQLNALQQEIQAQLNNFNPVSAGQEMLSGTGILIANITAMAAAGAIAAKAQTEINKLKQSGVTTEEQKRIDAINGITPTILTALLPPSAGYGTTSTAHAGVILSWGNDWITNAANGVTDTLTAPYSGAGIVLPPEWIIRNPANGIYEIPQTTTGGRGWSQSTQNISVAVTRVVTGTGGVASGGGNPIRLKNILPTPAKPTTTNPTNTVTRGPDTDAAAASLVVNISCDFTRGRECDLVYIQIEVEHTGTEVILGKKILAHLGQ